MAQKVADCQKRGKHKKTDRLTKEERRAHLLRRREQWLAQWIDLARTFIETLLNAEVAELLGRPAHAPPALAS